MFLLSSSKPYFWDVDFDKIDAQKNAVFIIERLFEWGDVAEVRWLQEAYPLTLLKEVLQKSKNLTPKSALFWAMLLSVPTKNLICIQKLSTKKPESAWKF